MRATFLHDAVTKRNGNYDHWSIPDQRVIGILFSCLLVLLVHKVTNVVEKGGLVEEATMIELMVVWPISHIYLHQNFASVQLVTLCGIHMVQSTNTNKQKSTPVAVIQGVAFNSKKIGSLHSHLVTAWYLTAISSTPSRPHHWKRKACHKENGKPTKEKINMPALFGLLFFCIFHEKIYCNI